MTRPGSGAPLDADLVAGVGTVGCVGVLSALGHQLVAEADVAGCLPESLLKALQGRATSGIPPCKRVIDRPTLAHGLRRQSPNGETEATSPTRTHYGPCS